MRLPAKSRMSAMRSLACRAGTAGPPPLLPFPSTRISPCPPNSTFRLFSTPGGVLLLDMGAIPRLMSDDQEGAKLWSND